MRPAKTFQITDLAGLQAHLRRHPYVTLCAAPEGRVLVAHAPVLVGRAGKHLTLDFHLSKANALAPYLSDGFLAVAVSHGPDLYVSDDWYESHEQVPTWNYVSVEAEGAVHALDDAELARQVGNLSAEQESWLSPEPPWTRGKASPGRFQAAIRGIVGARLVVERVQGAFKLSQHRSAADRDGARAAPGAHPIGTLTAGAG